MSRRWHEAGMVIWCVVAAINAVLGMWHILSGNTLDAILCSVLTVLCRGEANRHEAKADRA